VAEFTIMLADRGESRDGLHELECGGCGIRIAMGPKSANVSERLGAVKWLFEANVPSALQSCENGFIGRARRDAEDDWR
jgi:hypothetical protein